MNGGTIYIILDSPAAPELLYGQPNGGVNNANIQ